MSARTLAFVCLLSSLCSAASAPAASPESRPLFVYLSPGSNRNAPELDFMRSEANTLMRALGYRLEWRILGAEPAETVPELIIVTLSGNCTAPRTPQVAADGPLGGFSLASTATVAGSVLPFSDIHCAALTRSLAPAFAGTAPAERAFLYGRAMGRVLVHEFYHFLDQTRSHTAEGVGKAAFDLADLTANRPLSWLTASTPMPAASSESSADVR